MTAESLTAEVRLKEYESIIMRAQEVLLFKRPIAFAIVLLVTEISLGFIYSTRAEFFASILLFIGVVYAFMVAFAFYGEKINSFLFPEVEKDMNLIPFPKICEFLDKVAGKRKPLAPVVKAALFIGAGIFFRVVKPFWFFAVLINLVLIAPGLVHIILEKKGQQPPKEKTE